MRSAAVSEAGSGGGIISLSLEREVDDVQRVDLIFRSYLNSIKPQSFKV